MNLYSENINFLLKTIVILFVLTISKSCVVLTPDPKKVYDIESELVNEILVKNNRSSVTVVVKTQYYKEEIKNIQVNFINNSFFSTEEKEVIIEETKEIIREYRHRYIFEAIDIKRNNITIEEKFRYKIKVNSP